MEGGYMRELIKHWWILSVRALLAVTFTSCVAFVPGLLDTLFLDLVAVPFMIATLGVYAALDSILVMLLAQQFAGRSAPRRLLLAQGLSGMVIALCLLSVWFSSATLEWFVLLSIFQAALTGLYELAIARHFKRHTADAEATFVIGTISVAFSVTLAFLFRYAEITTALNWIVTYALFFGGSMMWFSLRLRAMPHKPKLCSLRSVA
jgi:hypothetical protein